MGSIHLPVWFIFLDWKVLFRSDVVVVVWTCFFLLVSSLRVASVWRKEIKGRNQVQFPLLYS